MSSSNARIMKLKIISAGEVAVDQLIKVARQDILRDASSFDEDDINTAAIAVDKLKNAAMTKKIAIFDAFEILARIEAEREIIESQDKGEGNDQKQGFAERRSK